MSRHEQRSAAGRGHICRSKPIFDSGFLALATTYKRAFPAIDDSEATRAWVLVDFPGEPALHYVARTIVGNTDGQGDLDAEGDRPRSCCGRGYVGGRQGTGHAGVWLLSIQPCGLDLLISQPGTSQSSRGIAPITCPPLVLLHGSRDDLGTSRFGSVLPCPYVSLRVLRHSLSPIPAVRKGRLCEGVGRRLTDAELTVLGPRPFTERGNHYSVQLGLQRHGRRHLGMADRRVRGPGNGTEPGRAVFEHADGRRAVLCGGGTGPRRLGAGLCLVRRLQQPLRLRHRALLCELRHG